MSPWAAALVAAERRGYEHAWAEVCRQHAAETAAAGAAPAANVGELVAVIVRRLQDEHVAELAGVRQAERDRIAAALQRRGAVAAAAVVRGLAAVPDEFADRPGQPLHLCGDRCRQPGAHG